jgi:hypothetical protein
LAPDRDNALRLGVPRTSGKLPLATGFESAYEAPMNARLTLPGWLMVGGSDARNGSSEI